MSKRRPKTEEQKARRRELDLEARYGITAEEYDRRVAEQGGRCAVCGGEPNGPGDRLHVDHDHRTNAVRALLCGKCNTGIGLFRDDPDLLTAAATYLRR